MAEGYKSMEELLRAGFHARLIVATEEWEEPCDVSGEATKVLSADTEVVRVTDEELRKVSFLQHPQQVLGVFDIPGQSGTTGHTGQSGNSGNSGRLVLALDGVQDPGNLCTIIRTADWFGVDEIVCSPLTADAYSPKVVQATMGSIARVKVTYCDLAEYLKDLPDEIPVFGTFLEGDDINNVELPAAGVIVMGNEGNGVSAEVAQLVNRKLFIPPYPNDGRRTAESLNVAIATAVILARFRCR